MRGPGVRTPSPLLVLAGASARLNMPAFWVVGGSFLVPVSSFPFPHNTGTRHPSRSVPYATRG